MTTTTTNRKSRICLASARLAASAAYRHTEDGDAEAHAAGARAGTLAWEAGITLDDLWTAVPELSGADMAWSVLVDAWYAARDAADVRLDEVCAVLAAAEPGGPVADLVTRLWAEVVRRRG